MERNCDGKCAEVDSCTEFEKDRRPWRIGHEPTHLATDDDMKLRRHEFETTLKFIGPRIIVLGIVMNHHRNPILSYLDKHDVCLGAKVKGDWARREGRKLW